MLTRHVPSHLAVAGHRILLSYDGLPATCYGCGEVGHMYQRCPAPHKSGIVRPTPTNVSYASIVSANAAQSENPVEDTVIEMEHNLTPGSAVHTKRGLSSPSHDTDATIVDTGVLNLTGLRAPLTPEGGRDAVANDALQRDDMVDATNKMEDNTTHGESPPRRRRDLHAHGLPSSSSDTGHHSEDLLPKRASENTNSNAKVHNRIHNDMETSQEVKRHSPQRNKKMKTSPAHASYHTLNSSFP
jgi:hypothetical protein